MTSEMYERSVTAVRYTKIGSSCLYIVILAIIVESIIRFLVPQREKRRYVLIFYTIASTITVVCLIESFYFAVHPN